MLTQRNINAKGINFDDFFGEPRTRHCSRHANFCSIGQSQYDSDQIPMVIGGSVGGEDNFDSARLC